MAGADTEGFKEAGGKTAGSTFKPTEVPRVITNTNPNDDPRYADLLSQLQGWHRDLLKLDLAQDPVKCGEYLGYLRLNCNKLFAYINLYIDFQIDMGIDVAVKRQNLYEQQLKLGKSPSASDKHASEMTRIDAANADVVKSRVQQIRNEYERYNGICLYLQSRMKEFNTERIMN